MPRQYEAIRDKFASQGMPLKQAKTHAAKIYNAVHPNNPVGRYSDSPPKPAFKFTRPTKPKKVS